MSALLPLATALAAGPVVLDGGLSTELEARGHDVSSALWSARLLRDDPAAIVAAHAAFAAAGAQVATTASYQATVEGFGAFGIGAAEARRLIASSVALAQEGQGEGWVAGSVGPYGAMLADGSEYTGAYVDEVGVDRLREFHRPRMEILAEAGAHVLACETVPAAAEAEALIAEADVLGVPVWLSLTTVAGRRRRRPHPARRAGGRRLRDGGGRRRGHRRRGELHRPGRRRAGDRGGGAQRQAGRRLSEQRRGLGRRRTAVDRQPGHRAGRRPGVGRRRRPAGRRLLPHPPAAHRGHRRRPPLTATRSASRP